jgi:tRNA nucleotidyltransferase (CCA-adding enzyme)
MRGVRAETLLSKLPRPSRSAVRRARELAGELGVGLSLAGGAVRDLLSGGGVRDVDLVVEGDGIAFARRLAERLGVAAVAHQRFGTATLTLPGGVHLDVASARDETYAHPGALPRVRPGDLPSDLARRDFSINAMALRLGPGKPRLEDPHGGRADLSRGLVRMLHSGSPRDDPTRAFRAVLYANRLGFRIAPATRRWIREAVASGAFERISGDRRRREIVRILSEPRRAEAISAMARLGIAASIHPALPADASAIARLRRAERDGKKPGWFVFLLVWAASLDETESSALARRLNLSRSETRALERWPSLVREAAQPGVEAPYRLSEDEHRALSALTVGRRRRRIEPAVRGRDLVAAGVPPGPAIGRALAATRAALSAGRIPPDRELAFAIAEARRDAT